MSKSAGKVAQQRAQREAAAIEAEKRAATAAALRAGSLPALASEINREHEAAERAINDSLQHARRCGELLNEAKASPEIKHGEWQAWVEDNFAASYRTAAGYMRIAKRWGDLAEAKVQGLAHLGVEEALKTLAEPREPEPTPEPEPIRRERPMVATEIEDHPVPLSVGDRPQDDHPTPEPVVSPECTEALAALPETDRPAATRLVASVVTSERKKVEVARNLAGMEDVEREETLRLAASADARDRSAAVSRAAGKPEGPDARETLLLDVEMKLRRVMDLCDRDEDDRFRERVRKVEEEAKAIREGIAMKRRSA